MSQLMRLGFDLEYAVRDKVTGHIIPAGELPITGIKGYPEKLRNGGVEIDCCAVEITPPPSHTETGFIENITNLLNEVKEKYPRYELLTMPSYCFTDEAIASTRMASTMGCSPDFNAWTGRMNPRPRPASGLRSFGGHIHIEGGNRATIRACDLVLGMWSVIADRDTRRRGLYGKAGAFRPKQYGVEYRVLSNFWCDDPALMKKVYNLTRRAQSLSVGTVNKLVEEFGGPKKVQEVINTSDLAAAKEIYGRVMEV